MAGDRDDVFPSIPNAIPALPLLHPKQPQRLPPAIPLRVFRSNPTHLPERTSEALDSINLESGDLESTTPESGELNKRPFYFWGNWPGQSDAGEDKLGRYLEQFEALDSRIADLQHDYNRFKNKPSPELFKLFSELVQLSIFKPFPNPAHIQRPPGQLHYSSQTSDWNDFRSDLKAGESDVLNIWYEFRPINHDHWLTLLSA